MTLPAIGVLCGGMATRLGAITRNLPKSLVLVAGEPFLAHQLRLLLRQGFRRVVLMLGDRGAQIRDFAGDGQKFGLTIDYSDEGDARLGTGGAVRKALPLLGDAFCVTYGDSFLDFDPHPMWQKFICGGADAMMAVLKNNNRWGRSNVVFDGNHVLVHDKLRCAIPGMEWIDWGMSIFSATVIQEWAEKGPFNLSDVTNELAKAGRLSGFVVTNRFYEIGHPDGLAQTEAYLTPGKGRSERAIGTGRE
jgi:NDP-sugar pyrophosphorylase family protein